MLWFIATLFAAAFAGLAYVLARALGDGMDRYAGAYSEQTARQFEDIFLFIPARRVTELGWAAAIAVFLVVFAALGGLTNLENTLPGFVLAAAAGAMTL